MKRLFVGKSIPEIIEELEKDIIVKIRKDLIDSIEFSVKRVGTSTKDILVNFTYSKDGERLNDLVQAVLHTEEPGEGIISITNYGYVVEQIVAQYCQCINKLDLATRGEIQSKRLVSRLNRLLSTKAA